MSKKIREIRIRYKLKSINGTIMRIKNRIPSKFEEFEKLDLIKDGIYKRIEFAIQSVVNICEIINFDLSLGIPENENSIIDNLKKNSIISEKLAEKLIKMKSFRNVLVHRYGEIDDKKAFGAIKKGIGDFDLFINEIEKFLVKQKR